MNQPPFYVPGPDRESAVRYLLKFAVVVLLEAVGIAVAFAFVGVYNLGSAAVFLASVTCVALAGAYVGAAWALLDSEECRAYRTWAWSA